MTHEKIFLDVGQRMIDLRGALTQAAFAERLGVDRKTIVGWETGKRLPDGTSLCRLVAEFGADLNYVLTGLSTKGQALMALLERITAMIPAHLTEFAEIKAFIQSQMAALKAALAVPDLTPRQRAVLQSYDSADEAGKKLIEATAAMAAQSTARTKREAVAQQLYELTDPATGQLRPGAQTKPDADGISVRVPLPAPKAVKRKTRSQTINAPVSGKGKKV
jgi:transcriptional regulator with XRE-family HTH domain